MKSVFSTTYEIPLLEEYQKTHKVKPLKSVPQETLQTMRTEMFLTSNYDMRNLMTGVAEYRMKYSEDQTFKPLTVEVRNDMTIEARELGLKSWDQDVNRFIDSTRIEQYDPVNTWLDALPKWDGEDRIAALAKRVPTNQPHWEKYLRYWLVGMVAQWRESDKQLTGNALTPLLIGRQGCGKTRFCKILLPPELRDYYNDKLNFKNEFDLNIALTSFALINIDEFDIVIPRSSAPPISNSHWWIPRVRDVSSAWAFLQARTSTLRIISNIASSMPRPCICSIAVNDSGWTTTRYRR